MLKDGLRGLALTTAFLVSWFGGALAYWAVLSGILDKRPRLTDLSAVGFWVFLIFLFGVPFHVQTVRTLTDPQSSLSRRLMKTSLWVGTVALASAVIVTALLGQGRVSGVMTAQGLLFLTWLSASAILFGTFGTIAYHLDIWVDPRPS